jgi:hypothetical protein
MRSISELIASGILRSPRDWSKVLSFGCSTGEELVGIRAILPKAHIYGCDISEPAVQLATPLASNLSCKLFISTSEAVTAHGPYDIIFAMSCLCLCPAGANPDGTAKLRPDVYQMLLSGLVDNLSPGGLLIIYNSQYRVHDFIPAHLLQPLPSLHTGDNGFVPRFQKDGRPALTKTATLEGISIYHLPEQPNPVNFQDDDLRISIYVKSPPQGAIDTIVAKELSRLSPPANYSLLGKSRQALQAKRTEARLGAFIEKSVYVHPKGAGDVIVVEDIFFPSIETDGELILVRKRLDHLSLGRKKRRFGLW